MCDPSMAAAARRPQAPIVHPAPGATRFFACAQPTATLRNRGSTQHYGSIGSSDVRPRRDAGDAAHMVSRILRAVHAAWIGKGERAVAIGSLALCGLPAAALQCPAMPQQASRDAEVEVRVGVRMLGDAKGAELQTRTRQLTTELMSRLPRADQVYLEQMLFASYCSALRDNPALGESEREARIGAYAREMRAALKSPPPTTAPPVDPRDRARAELDRLPVPYTIDAFVDAAERGDARVVGLFIAAGVDVNARDRAGITALAQAAGRGDLPMVQALLKAGAKDDQPGLRIGCRRRSDRRDGAVARGRCRPRRGGGGGALRHHALRGRRACEDCSRKAPDRMGRCRQRGLCGRLGPADSRRASRLARHGQAVPRLRS